MSATHTHADRDLIKARAEADFLNLFEEHGGRQRRKALDCIFAEDRNPSASIHKGRFNCSGCNLSVDVFEFIAKAQGTDFRGALLYLANRYGVSLNNRVLTYSERQQYAEYRRIREDALYFEDAARIEAEEALEALSPVGSERDQTYAPTNGAAGISRGQSTANGWSTIQPGPQRWYVHAGRERDRRLQMALAEWIAEGMPEVSHAA